MKKYIIGAVFATLCLAALIGCSPQKASEETSGVSELLKYKDSYVGDNSAVGNLLNNLEGGQFIRQFALHTKEEPYGIEITYGPKDATNQNDFEKDWGEGNFKKTFMGNATAIFSLIKNVDYINVILESDESKTLTVTREDMEKYYGEDLRTFSENEELWREKIIKATSDTSDKIESFFKEHVKSN